LTDDCSLFLFPRLSTKVDYEEELELEVKVNTNGKERTLVYEIIKGKKQFNSWFYHAFVEKIVLLKGTKCSIEVRPMREASYLLIGATRIRGAKCLVTKLKMGSLAQWCEYEQKNYIFKNVSFKLI